jgi:hypothetical protein
MLAEAMRQMANHDDRHVHQRPEPNQYSTFREVEEPLQADEWLNTIEQKFHLLRVTEGMKASYTGNQLHRPASI